MKWAIKKISNFIGRTHTHTFVLAHFCLDYRRRVVAVNNPNICSLKIQCVRTNLAIYYLHQEHWKKVYLICMCLRVQCPCLLNLAARNSNCPVSLQRNGAYVSTTVWSDATKHRCVANARGSCYF